MINISYELDMDIDHNQAKHEFAITYYVLTMYLLLTITLSLLTICVLAKDLT
jgi:hypothetical protein